jgi:RNA polymerase sigma-70 factor (ECF subfamily)
MWLRSKRSPGSTPTVYAVVLRFVGDGCEAEDVLQETLLRAWRGIGRFQSRAMVFTWLYRIAVNESNRALERRVRRRATVPVDEEAVQVPAPPQEGPADQAEQQELREVLSRWPSPCRRRTARRSCFAT